MFIAHLPAGYLLTRWLLARGQEGIPATRALFVAGLAGALAPDLDLIAFFLLDGRYPHHMWPSHWPLAWLSLLALAWWLEGGGRMMLRVFALNGLGHMVLDSVAGDIRWLAPFSDQAFSLVVVPARHHPWWLNFILHWTFLLEVLLTAWALWCFRRSSGRGSADRARSARPESVAPARGSASGHGGCAAARGRR